MKWIVSGTWDHTNEPGSMTLTAGSKAEAYAVAKARGMTAIEAMGVGAPATAAPPAKGKPGSKTVPAPPVDRAHASPAPRSPLRAKAARLAVPIRSAAGGVVLAIVGFVVVILGTYFTYELGPDQWAGEMLQLAGVIGLVIGLRTLDA